MDIALLITFVNSHAAEKLTFKSVIICVFLSDIDN
jgi:hypothetical protein